MKRGPKPVANKHLICVWNFDKCRYDIRDKTSGVVMSFAFSLISAMHEITRLYRQERAGNAH